MQHWNESLILSLTSRLQSLHVRFTESGKCDILILNVIDAIRTADTECQSNPSNSGLWELTTQPILHDKKFCAIIGHWLQHSDRKIMTDRWIVGESPLSTRSLCFKISLHTHLAAPHPLSAFVSPFLEF